ncbi:unnamed protein product [Staurois parvus]|uniref:Uncharacterized protein n=1 Tax=Staurois parvus TaxID=386267 RepID=A0ABN9D3J9_9NEOB|nr:unnamed protein product [Staurois parvus]
MITAAQMDLSTSIRDAYHLPWMPTTLHKIPTHGEGFTL